MTCKRSAFGAVVALGIFHLIAVSVLPEALAQQSGPTPEYFKVNHFVSHPIGIRTIQSLQSLRQIGNLKSDQSTLKLNRYDKWKFDDHRTLSFDGLIISVMFPERDYGRGLIWGVVVTEPKWQMEYGIAVGMPRRKVKEILGEPFQTGPDMMKYCGDLPCVTFYFESGKVSKLVFEASVE